MSEDLGRFEQLIRDIPDYPTAGVTFKDITPLLSDPVALSDVIDLMIAPARSLDVTKVIGVEARGFILAAPAAMRLGAGFVPVRKPGKLPGPTHGVDYELEYGTDRLEIHRDALTEADRVLVVDDVLATGGTAAATAELVAVSGASVVGMSFLLELTFLNGRHKLGSEPTAALLTWDGN